MGRGSCALELDSCGLQYSGVGLKTASMCPVRLLCFAAAALWAAPLGGCDFPAAQECTRSAECRDDRVCSFGRCVPPRSPDGGAALATAIRCGQHVVEADTCLACVADACCDEMARCRADERCAAYLGCVAGCDAGADPRCRTRCLEGYVVSDPEHPTARLLHCAESECPAACGGCGSGVIAAAACGACVEASESVCEDVSVCLDDPDCAVRLNCAVGCADPRECVEVCYQFARDQGGDAFFTAANNVIEACSGPCEFGARMECTGDFSWGGAAAETVHLIAIVGRQLLPNQPVVPGVRVRVCAATDPLCAQPLAEDVSGPDGRADLQVPTGHPAGVAYYVEAVHPEGLTLPTIYYPVAPRLLVDLRFDVAVVGEAEATLLEGLLRQQRDPAAAQLLLRVFDCRVTPAPGVSMALDVGGEPFYLDGAIPSTAIGRTSMTGVGGFPNVPVPGGEFAGVEARLTLADEGRLYATRGLLLRPGWVTIAFIAPNER